MAASAASGLPGDQILQDGPALWGRAWGNPRPLAIDSASYYAQEHGLTFDFYTESSKRAAVHLISLKKEYPRNGKDRMLNNCSRLTHCTIPTSGISDCWVDTESTVTYLQQLPSALDDLFSQSVHISGTRFLAAKTLKCETPILRSDNNLDLLGLVDEIYGRRAVPSAGTEIPLAEPDASGDDGLQFPSWSDQLMKHFDNHLFKEGIQNLEDSQLSGDASSHGFTSVVNPDKESTCGLIDIEYTMFKRSRVRAFHALSHPKRATLLTVPSPAKQYCLLHSCPRDSLTTFSSRTVRPAP